MDPEPTGLTLDEWIERLRTALGSSDPGIELGLEEREALLELTRVAAHASQRIAAPFTAFLVGAAVDDLSQPARIERIRALTVELRTSR
jgi:hypothetical protein